MSPHMEERPIQVDGAPAQEGLSRADVADRLKKDPEKQRNRTDPDQPVEDRTE
ncbi:hypothetical protein [Nocardioides mesophilus]|uniref:Uncharacterized protein n=1 Tax=Nocardioides mesophilus TaxID=433659 RepID=A0A7G9RCI1_9ACTN|nr:hypothetical protein [Nocardioides mesophilus]QNN53306.1 hypothetical protein H9L09_02170 [Nocardioides mesophilus]